MVLGVMLVLCALILFCFGIETRKISLRRFQRWPEKAPTGRMPVGHRSRGFPASRRGMSVAPAAAISINALRLLSCGCRFTPRQPSVMTLTA